MSATGAARQDPPAASGPLVALSGLHVKAGDTEILRGIDLSVERGEFLAIVGESGSGKTTLVNTVLRLLPPEFDVAAARLEVAGQDMRSLSPRLLRKLRGKRVGYVPQDPGTSLNPVKSIGSQLGEIFRLHERGISSAEVRRRSLELLDRVGIDHGTHRLRQYPHQLSGGQRQRVLIAIAFALSPELLIADEPTSALDATVQQQVMEVFARLARQSNTTVLFITHDIALATDYATRLVVLKDGLLIEDGSLESIVVAPRHQYTRFLLHGVSQSGTGQSRVGQDGVRQDGVKLDELPSAVGEAADGVAIAVNDLSKTFRLPGRRALPAVRHVTFAVPKGTTFALVGESGSGKSTTARLVMGLEHPTGGAVELGGRPVRAGNRATQRDLWRKIQLVHQNPYASLNPRDQVADIVSAPLRAHKVGTPAARRARVDELLDFVALPRALKSRRPAELSGGQRQRVAVARALALSPQVIVLDEPLSALDVVTQTQVIDLLKRLQRELSLTYLFITHDLAVVRDLADSVGVLSRGQLVESGPVATVLESPQTKEAQDLVRAQPGERARALLESAAPAPGAEGAAPGGTA